MTDAVHWPVPAPNTPHDLNQQLTFLREIDQLKQVNRNNLLTTNARPENTAEHSWHVALLALVAAPYFPKPVDIDRAIAMLLIHDIVEIDAGDHPIHLRHDNAAIAAKEEAAATRLFGLLPAAQDAALHSLWREFDTGTSDTAVFARSCDHLHPELMVMTGALASDKHIQIGVDNLATGRASRLKQTWPAAYDLLDALHRDQTATGPLADITAFIHQTDALKQVLRATPILSDPRQENSGEHSWHLAMFGLILSGHATDLSADTQAATIIKMLLIHDIVEVDVGDTPIHGSFDAAEIESQEQVAAARIFGLLPHKEGTELTALWQEFEAAESPNAIFAKSIDRAQPVLANLAQHGGTWPTYHVTREQLEARVAAKIKRGFPALWNAIKPEIDLWFANNT